MTEHEMNNELRDKAIAHLRDARRHFAQQQEAEPVAEVGKGQILQWAPPYKRCPEGTKLYARPPKPAALPELTAVFETVSEDTTGQRDVKVKRVEHQDDGSVTVVLDYWPQDSPAAQPQVPEGYQLVPIFPTDEMTSVGVDILSERGIEMHDHIDIGLAYKAMLSAAKENS